MGVKKKNEFHQSFKENSPILSKDHGENDNSFK